MSPRSAAELRALAEREGLLAPGARVVVMLSGGRDSVCLLDLAVAVAGGGAVRALHVNYGLRPEADGDESHCARLCGLLGVPLAIERAAAPGAGNLQAWARDVRYAAAGRSALRDDALVATGHTATDQVETVLYRLASSPGRRALLGMKARDGRLVRPLLSFTREETMSYCRERGLEWREDASNGDPAFARARVRHGLVEALRALHPAAEANLLRTVELLRDEAAMLDELVGEALAAGDGRAIAVASLRALPGPLARLVVQQLADAAAGRLAPGAGGRASEVAALGEGAALDIGGGVRALVSDGVLRMSASEGPAARAPRAAAGDARARL